MFLSIKKLNKNLWFFALCYGKHYKYSGVAKTRKEAFSLSRGIYKFLLASEPAFKQILNKD